MLRKTNIVVSLILCSGFSLFLSIETLQRDYIYNPASITRCFDARFNITHAIRKHDAVPENRTFFFVVNLFEGTFSVMHNRLMKSGGCQNWEL